jgi:hypothetical protein
VRDSKDAVAGKLKHGVALAVPLEGRPIAVIGEAIELDHEALPPPDRVDLHPSDEDVEAGRRKAGVAAKAEEAGFELGAGHLCSVPMDFQEAPENTHATTPTAVIQHSVKRTEIEQLQSVSLRDRPLKLGRGEEAG